MKKDTTNFYFFLTSELVIPFGVKSFSESFRVSLKDSDYYGFEELQAGEWDPGGLWG